jgi:hypothetical protein
VFQVSRTASGPSGSATAAATGAAEGSAADIGFGERRGGRIGTGGKRRWCPLDSARACGGVWRWLRRSRSPGASSVCAYVFFFFFLI